MISMVYLAPIFPAMSQNGTLPVNPLLSKLYTTIYFEFPDVGLVAVASCGVGKVMQRKASPGGGVSEWTGRRARRWHYSHLLSPKVLLYAIAFCAISLAVFAPPKSSSSFCRASVLSGYWLGFTIDLDEQERV